MELLLIDDLLATRKAVQVGVDRSTEMTIHDNGAGWNGSVYAA